MRNTCPDHHRHRVKIPCYFRLISCSPVCVLIFKMRQEHIHPSLHVPCLAHLLRNDVLFAAHHMYDLDVLVVPIFPRTIPTHLVSFPSFSFQSLFSFLFFPWHFIYFGVLLNFPRFLSIFLVSFSYSSFPLLLFFLGRLFFSMVRLPLHFFFLCSILWSAWDHR